MGRIANRVTNSNLLALFRLSSAPCSTVPPQQCFKPLIAQSFLNIGASNKSTYSPFGIPLAPLSCLGVQAVQPSAGTVFGCKIKLLAELLHLGCPEFRLPASVVQRASLPPMYCIVDRSFLAAEDRSISFPILKGYPLNYRHYRPSTLISDVRLKGYGPRGQPRSYATQHT